MAPLFHLFLAAATPKPGVSPIASPVPAPATSGGVNVLLIVLAALVVILLILLLAFRRGGRNEDSLAPELEKRLVPMVPHTPDDGVNAQERQIYKAQPTPFGTLPTRPAEDPPAPVTYQPEAPPAVPEPQQPPPLPPPPQPAGMPAPAPDPALYHPPTDAPAAYPEAAPRTPESFPPPITSAPVPGPEPVAAGSASTAMDPVPPSSATSFAFPPVSTEAAPSESATAAPFEASATAAALDARPEVMLPAAPPPPVESIPPPPPPVMSPESTPTPEPEAASIFSPPTPPGPAAPEPGIPALVVPAAEPGPVTVPLAPEPTPAWAAADGQLILLIEDDERIAKFYSILFEAKGYQVRNARDGIEGVDMANTLKPALILLDVMMPKMNGLMVLQTLRGNPLTEHTPVVVLSNYMEPPLIQRALQLGAIEYVVKSQARPEQLVNAVPSWLVGEPALH